MKEVNTMLEWIAKISSGKFGIWKLILALLILLVVLAIATQSLFGKKEEPKASSLLTECSPNISNLMAKGSISIENSGCNK